MTALLLVGLVSSSCSDSELNFGSVVGDSEDLKLKFKSKFKFKFKLPVISGCPGRAQYCLSTNSTLHSELLESDSESVLVSYSDSARGSESLSLSESSLLRVLVLSTPTRSPST